MKVRHMMLLVLLLASLAWSKDTIKVTVAATHAVTHEDRGARAIVDKAIMGANAPTKQSESFNLDAPRDEAVTAPASMDQ